MPIFRTELDLNVLGYTVSNDRGMLLCLTKRRCWQTLPLGTGNILLNGRF